MASQCNLQYVSIVVLSRNLGIFPLLFPRRIGLSPKFQGIGSEMRKIAALSDPEVLHNPSLIDVEGRS